MDRGKRRGWTLDEQSASQGVDSPAGRVGTPDELASLVVDGGVILRRV